MQSHRPAVVRQGAVKQSRRTIDKTIDSWASGGVALARPARDQMIGSISYPGARMSASSLSSVHPLSPLQEGILFHGLYEPRAARYVEQTVLELAGEIDAAALEAAFAYALARHPGLRTGFHWQGLDRPLA